MDAFVDDLFADDNDMNPPPVHNTIPMARVMPTTAPKMSHHIPALPKTMNPIPQGAGGLAGLSPGHLVGQRPPPMNAAAMPKGPVAAPMTTTTMGKYPAGQLVPPNQGIIPANTLPSTAPSTGFAHGYPKAGVTAAPGGGLASISTQPVTRPNMATAVPIPGNSGPPNPVPRPQPVSQASSTAAMSRPAPSTTPTAGPAAKKQVLSETGQTRARNADGSAASSKDQDDDEEDLITKEVEYVASEPIRHGATKMSEEELRRERSKDEARKVANVRVVRAKIDEICGREKIGVGSKVADALALGLQRRLEDVMKSLVILSKRRLDTDADSEFVVRSSNVRLFLKDQDQKRVEAREKRIAEKEAAVAGTTVMDPSAQRRQEEETAATVLDMAAPRRTTTLTLAALAPNAGSAPGTALGSLSAATLGSNAGAYSSASASSIKERQRRVTLHDALHFLTSDPHSRHSKLTLSTLAGLKVPEPTSISPAQYAATAVTAPSAPTQPTGVQTRSSAQSTPSSSQAPQHPHSQGVTSTTHHMVPQNPPPGAVQGHQTVTTRSATPNPSIAPNRPVSAQNLAPTGASMATNPVGGLSNFSAAPHPGQGQPVAYQVRPAGQVSVKPLPGTAAALPSAAPASARPSAAPPAVTAKPAVSTRSAAAKRS
jgi:hypothetical protein